MINSQSQPLRSTNIVLTGEFGVSREELSNYLSGMGATIQRTVYKNTSYLLYGASHGLGSVNTVNTVNTHPKYQKAIGKGVKIISFYELENLLRTKLLNSSFSIFNEIKKKKEEQRLIIEEKSRKIELQKRLFEQIEYERKRIFFNNSELNVDRIIKTPSYNTTREIIDRWVSRSVAQGKLMRDKIINQRRKLDEINEINWNVENTDWGQADPKGRLFICYRKEWYNKHKEEETHQDKIFKTSRQALIYCCKKSFDCLSEDAKEEGQIFDYKEVIKMNDEQLSDYYDKLREQMECEHQGEEYFFRLEEHKIPTNSLELYKEVSGINHKQQDEKYKLFRRKYEFTGSY
jgi:hypothetical protein